MTIDLSRTGAVSAERAAEQEAQVTRVYAGKSETPRTIEFSTINDPMSWAPMPDEGSFEFTSHEDAKRAEVLFHAQADRISALEKETARLKSNLRDVIAASDHDGQYSPSCSKCTVILKAKELLA